MVWAVTCVQGIALLYVVVESERGGKEGKEQLSDCYLLVAMLVQELSHVI